MLATMPFFWVDAHVLSNVAYTSCCLVFYNTNITKNKSSVQATVTITLVCSCACK